MVSRKRPHPIDADFRGDSPIPAEILAESERRAGKGEQETKPVIRRTNGMPIINFSEYALDEIPELKILPAGSEVRLRILEVTIAPDRNNDEMMTLRLDVEDEPLVKEIYWRCTFPNGRSMSEKRVITLRQILSAFCDAFEIDKTADNDTSDWPGRTAWAILGVRTDPRYGDSNEITRWLKQR